MGLMQQKRKGDETIITFLHQASSISPFFSLEVCVFFASSCPSFSFQLTQIDGIEEENTLLEVAKFVGSNPACLSSLKISRVLFYISLLILLLLTFCAAQRDGTK